MYCNRHMEKSNISNMVVKIKSKNQVLVDTYDNVSAYPECELSAFISNGDKYFAKGQYFYMDEEDRKVIKNFDKDFTPEQIDQLFASLNLSYPEDSTYSEQDYINRMAGLKYIVASEGRFGLTINDWE